MYARPRPRKSAAWRTLSPSGRADQGLASVRGLDRLGPRSKTRRVLRDFLRRASLQRLWGDEATVFALGGEEADFHGPCESDQG